MLLCVNTDNEVIQTMKQKMKCKHCESEKTKKNGKQKGAQRYMCHECKKTFWFKVPKIAETTKRLAVKMYINSVGIRKTAKLLGVSTYAVIYWVKQANTKVEPRSMYEGEDEIELDEIYTIVKKNGTE